MQQRRIYYYVAKNVVPDVLQSYSIIGSQDRNSLVRSGTERLYLALSHQPILKQCQTQSRNLLTACMPHIGDVVQVSDK